MELPPSSEDKFLDKNQLLLRALLVEANKAQIDGQRARCEAAIKQIYEILDAIIEARNVS